MKAIIEIEQFDNGISLKWRDVEGEIDPEAVVAVERDVVSAVGKTIWEDVKSVMDSALANTVKLRIEYEPIKEEQQ